MVRLRVFARAPSRRYGPAQVVVAAMHGTGTGTPKDEAQAARYYELAAAQGLVHAQFNLALLYLHGKGVDRSLIEAKRFLRLAAAQGHQVASEQLAQLERYDSAGAPADPAGLFSSLPVRSYDEVEGATVTNDVTDATVTNDDAVSVLSSHDSITPELVQALSYKAESDVHSKS